MSLFKRLFGPTDPLAAARRYHDQQRWADLLALAEGVGKEGLEAAAREELEGLETSAGDHLARLNLSEGEGCLRSGNLARALEHFSLASGQARSAELREKVEQARAGAGARPSPPSPPRKAEQPEAPPAAAHGCGPSCGSSCGPESEVGAQSGGVDLEEQEHLELLLAAYPPELAARCLQAPAAFRQALLQAHEGREQEALDLLEAIPRAERDDLFHFERGALLARRGETEEAREELERALGINPGHQPALETLVDLEMTAGLLEGVRERLEKLLEQGAAPAFCQGRLALLAARQGDREGALGHAEKAMAAGSRDGEVFLLVAGLYEAAGRLDEAQGLLARLSTPGCGGGANTLLAEFWLRHGTSLDRALEAFKGALRQEPDNARWPMRIAQVYLAKGWKREGLPLLERALAHPGLPAELQAEGMALLQGREGR